MAHRPVVGITTDLLMVNGVERAAAASAYARAVVRAGGVPILLPPEPEAALDQLALCRALVFTGGDDPRTEPFGQPTDPRVTPVHEQRQRQESLLLSHLADRAPDTPVLGVCLGMQMMALHAGGMLNQFMPDTTPTHREHWDAQHQVRSLDDGQLADGSVHSRHKQAVSHPGSMVTLAVAHDGVIEAVRDPARRFYLGVQWHPERTGDGPLGLELFARLIDAAR